MLAPESLPRRWPRRHALSAANQPPRQRTGGLTIAIDRNAGDDRRNVAVRALQKTAAAAWQIVGHFGWTQLQPGIVDHIDVCLISRCQYTAVSQANCGSGIARQ